MYQLRILQATTLKQSTNQALQLTDRQKIPISKNTLLPISSYALQAGHIKFSLGKNSAGEQLDLAGRNTWFAYLPHAELLKDGVAIAPYVSPSTSLPGPTNHLRMNRSGACDQFGGELFKLSWIKDGRLVDALHVVSGQPGLKGVRCSDDHCGSMRPCPEGTYRLGEVEEGRWGDAIGDYWISINGTEPREAVGIHQDANRAWAPGTAGCLGALNQSDMIRICGWRNAGAAVLVVDHGLGSL